jgi:hypothetical protein
MVCERVRRVVDCPCITLDVDLDFDFDSARDWDRGRNSLLVVGNGGADAVASDDDIVRSVGVRDSDLERVLLLGIVCASKHDSYEVY